MTAIPNWTSVTNSFEHGTASPYSTLAASSQYAQGGPFSESEIKQEIAIVDGYQYGKAVLTCARANVLADDTGTVILEALSGAGAVLDSVTTDAVAYATLDVWTRVRLALDLPDGTVTLRVRLLATRTLGTGNSGAAFDDFDLRVFKDLDATDVLDLDFSTIPVQPLVTSWQEFHLAFPDLSGPPMVVAAGALAISAHRAYSGQSIAWSDAIAHTAGTAIGAFGGGVTSAPSFVFVRALAAAAIDLQITGGSDERGAFTSEGSFVVRVVLKVDEPGFATACGLIGRRTAAGIGWGIQIDAAGTVKAILQGVSGTKTATSATTVTDGAIHAVAMVYDSVADTLRIYVDRRGYTETSTAAALGEFAVTSETLRIGRDASTSATGNVQILEALVNPTGSVAWTQAEVESMWTYGSDPTGEIDTYNRAIPAYVDLDGESGAELACMASDQIAIGHHAATDTTGLATCPTMTNLITTFDFANAKWTRGSTLTKTGGTNGDWDAGAASVQTITGDGYVEFTVDTKQLAFVGIAKTTNPTFGEFSSADYAFGLFSSELRAYELGVDKSLDIAYSVGARLRINRTGTTITFLMDGVLVMTSATASTGDLRIDVSLFTSADTVSGIGLVDAGVNEDLTWTTSGVTASTAAKVLNATDCTGLARGVTLTIDGDNGFRHTGITVGAVAKIGVTFWAKVTSVLATSIDVKLKSSAGVVKDTVSVDLEAEWQRFDVMFDAWDASSATCEVEWIGQGAARTIALAHIVAVYQAATLAESQHPTLIPAVAGAGFTSVDGVWAYASRTMPMQWSAEGELDVQGVATTAAPAVTAAVVQVNNASVADNRRLLRVDDDSASPEFVLYDGAGSGVSNEATAIDWTAAWRLRARWNRAGILESPGDFGGIVVDGSADSAVYDQNTAWTDDTAVLANEIYLGVSSLNSIRIAAYLSRVTLRTGCRPLT